MVLGLNHKTAPVTVREQFALERDAVRQGLENLAAYPAVREATVLSTCNRSEIYAVLDGKDSSENERELKYFWQGMTRFAPNAEAYLYKYVAGDCIRHLFRVAGGLDSLILGEGQILSQVKAAYALAKQAGATGTILNTLFHRAIATGKRIRTQTRIAYNSVSVSYAAVELAKKKLGNLNGKKALIFGAGKMAQLTAKHLQAQKIGRIYVANRHLDKAETLAAEIGGKALTFSEAMSGQFQTDIIVTSTGAPHYVLQTEPTQKLMAGRGGRELFIVDIAVPRDVEPEVGNIPGVTLYNIDDLEAVVDNNIKLREAEAKLAGKIVEEELAALQTKFQYLTFQPLMAKLSQRSEKIRQRELKRARTKLPDLDEQDWRQVEHLSQMIVRKLLRVPMMKLTMAAGTEQEDFYAAAYQAMFRQDNAEEVG